MLYQNPAIRSRVEVHLVEEAKGGPSKLLLSFLYDVDDHCHCECHTCLLGVASLPSRRGFVNLPAFGVLLLSERL
jgi:hypothetical protein